MKLTPRETRHRFLFRWSHPAIGLAFLTLSTFALGGTTSLTVRAYGTLAGNIGPQMQVIVDGQTVGSVEVRAPSYQDYTFTAAATTAGSTINVVFGNDAVINGADRNLYVESITVNGTPIASTNPTVVYDRGPGAAAFDGQDVMAGQAIMMWNGAMRFRVPTAASVASMANPKASLSDAMHLADQATFGATEASIAEIQTKGAPKWVLDQLALYSSRYLDGKTSAVHQNTSNVSFCDLPANSGPNCWRDWYSTTPLAWDFYRNATRETDQLRQRVAFALQQMLVVSEIGVGGTYGFRNYHNSLLANTFGTYRQILKKVALSPVMGEFLNNVNNNKSSPNENFARELLQLFSLGTCQLNADGSLQGGVCTPTYDNDLVRNYAYALTGWTYPPGGATYGGCWPAPTNCRYYEGDMVSLPPYHDAGAHPLLSNVSVSAGSTSAQALDSVLDSLMAHPNMAPFISRQLIQHLVTSNPSNSYVQRVAAAFTAGRYSAGGYNFGTGQRGDLGATTAAILLDSEARATTVTRSAGKLREPALMFTGIIRALNGKTDGDALGAWFGGMLSQRLFYSPSVFNFYPATYPVPGQPALNGPAFGIHNAGTALSRDNFLTYLLYNGGSAADATVPGAIGTQISTAAFEGDAADSGRLVDRLSYLATGGVLPDSVRAPIVAAVDTINSVNRQSWAAERVKQAAYLIFASPNYQVQH